MIEMHQDGEPLGDDDDDRVAMRGGPRLAELAFGPAALSIAALVVATVDMLTVHVATVVSDLHEISFKGSSVLSGFRIDAAIHLGVAVLALALAIAAGVRVRRLAYVDVTDDDEALLGQIDEQTQVEPWVSALVGAAVIVTVIAVGLAGSALGYTLATQVPPGGGPFG